MTVDRLTDGSATPGPRTGNDYLDQVAEEILALWNTASVITISGVSGTNTITGTITPPLISGFLDGMNFILTPVATNTGAVTFNGTAVVDAEGVALTAGALRINSHVLLHYDGGLAKLVVVGYAPAAVVPYGAKLLRFQSVAAVASIDFVHGVSGVVLDSTYDSYIWKINSAAPVTDDVEAWLRIGTGAGPTYQTANYSWYSHAVASNVAADVASTSDSKIAMTRQSGTADVGNASGETFSATINFHDPDMNQFFSLYGQASYRCASGVPGWSVFNGTYNVQSAITALRFQFETGNIASATSALYGLTSS